MKKFIFLASVIAFSVTVFSCVTTDEVQVSYDKSVLQGFFFADFLILFSERSLR